MSCFSSKFRLVCTLMIVVRSTSEYEIDSGVCGIRNISVQARIVNGSVSKEGYWPWMVLINRNGEHYCGGTLISGQWILTVAHCFETDDLNSYSAIVGAYKDDASGTNAVEVKIHVLICHKDYESDTFVDDICLIKLSEPVEFTNYIIPACLPTKGSSVNVGESCFVTGWGETMGTGSNSKLREAEVFVLDTEKCKKWYGEADTLIPENHFCAGYQQGKIDACQGDSGGPLVCEEKNDSVQSAYVLRGMTSFGIGCAVKERPGVYVKVVDYLDWIEKKMEHFEDESCASYESIICGGNIVHNTTIRSPTVPGIHTYPANSKCLWKILGPKGYIIKFTFICYFLLSPLSDNQCRDYATITDAATGVRKTFCGNEIPESYTVNNNTAFFYFESNDLFEYPGFVVEIQILPNTTTEPTITPSLEFTSTSGDKRKEISVIFLFITTMLILITEKS